MGWICWWAGVRDEREGGKRARARVHPHPPLATDASGFWLHEWLGSAYDAAECAPVLAQVAGGATCGEHVARHQARGLSRLAALAHVALRAVLEGEPPCAREEVEGRLQVIEVTNSLTH